MILLRRILFYLFAAVYLIFCPITILYALGYWYQGGAQSGIVRTGLVYLSTAPPGASVYLGNMRFAKKTPTILRDLTAGDYTVRLVLKGRRPWTQTVPVEAEKATVLERVLLLPQSWKRQVVWQEAFRNLTPMPGTSFFLAVKGPHADDLFLFDWKAGRGRPLFGPRFPLRRARVLKIFSVPESSAFLLQIRSGSADRYVWVEPKDDETDTKDLTHLFAEKPSDIAWDPDAKDRLFAFRDARLDRLSIASSAVFPRFLENVQGFGFFNKSIYVLQTHSLFLRTDHEGKKVELLLDDLALGRSLFGSEAFFKVRVFSKDIIVFLSSKGQLLANRLPYRFVDEGVRDVSFDLKRERALVWQEDKLGVLAFDRDSRSEDVFEKAPKLAWIYRKGGDLEQAFWVYEGSHVLFRDRDTVYLLEVETYGKPHLYSILQVKPKSNIFYSEESGKLYYLDSKTEFLTTMEILPRWHLLLPFPERAEQKKTSPLQEAA